MNAIRPYDDYPAYDPGEMWTYSDLNLVHLCNALAKVYGKQDFYDSYDDVAREAYFGAIGLEGWTTRLCQTCMPYRDPGDAIRIWV